MQQFEIAKARLFDKDELDVKNINVFPGACRDVTPEQVAEQINRSISQIEAGDFEEVDLND
jgi:hypothetical protein